MSDVTDMRCAVRSGDLSAAAFSSDFAVAMASFVGRGTAGTSGGGESSRLSWADEVDESHLLRSERGRDRSDWESGRGVISVASSKSSWNSGRGLACAFASSRTRGRHPGPCRGGG